MDAEESKDMFLDWRGKPCEPAKHGGLRAAACVLSLQSFELMACSSVGNNLITYVRTEIHFSTPKSANVVTNFVGTIFLMSLLGGFLSDSYLGCFHTILIFGSIELLGLILLAIQAHVPHLRPPPCNMSNQADQCVEAKGFQAYTFYLALFLVALGSGCLKPNIACHGANQFMRKDPKQSKKLSIFFNAGYFTVQVSMIIALTVLVWLQTHLGMDVGFSVASAIMLMGLITFTFGISIYKNNPPTGNIFTSITQVFVAAFMKRKLSNKPAAFLHGSQNHPDMDMISDGLGDLVHKNKFRFLDKACVRTEDDDRAKHISWRLCKVTQVEEVKILISVIPIFASTIIFNTIFAQLQTFTVEQGRAMNRHVTKQFEIPPASLQAILSVLLVILVPLYQSAFIPLTRKFTKIEPGVSTLQRVGVGLFLVPFSMLAAALTEVKRRNAADLHEILSIFWLLPQFIIFGVAEMFTVVGLIEFFYRQSLGRIQCFLIAISHCSYSFGFYLSSLLVSVVNKITSSSSVGGWVSHNVMNNNRLDHFYWLLAALSALNFVNYLYWSKWFSYNPSLSHNVPHESGCHRVRI